MRVIAFTLNEREFGERGIRMSNLPVVCQLVTGLCHVYCSFLLLASHYMSLIYRCCEGEGEIMEGSLLKGYPSKN